MSKRNLAKNLGLVVVGTLQLDNIGVMICKDKHERVHVTIQDDKRVKYVGEYRDNNLDSFKSELLMKLMNYGLTYNMSAMYRDAIVHKTSRVAGVLVVEVI